MNKQIVISQTAKAHGFGSARYKWVSGLTKEEQRHVKDNDAIVIVTHCPGHINGVSGVKYRQVSYGSYGYKHFIPNAETIKTLTDYFERV